MRQNRVLVVKHVQPQTSFPRLWLDLFRTKVRIAPELGYNDNSHTILQRVMTSQTLEPWWPGLIRT